MSYIEIDDDDDDLVIESEFAPQPQPLSKEEQARAIIKQGMNDIEDILALLEKIEKLIEPFGDLETILELKTLYGEVIPDILLGNYDNVIGAMPEDAKEITMVMIKQRRKNMFNKLSDKYN